MAIRHTSHRVLTGFLLCLTMHLCSRLVFGEGPMDVAGTWV